MLTNLLNGATAHIKENDYIENTWSKFCKDLQKAKKYEIYVKELFEEQGFIFNHFNDDNRYDIEMMSKKGWIKKIEVKSDKMAGDGSNGTTKNIIFEYKAYKKPSGISVCKADYFVYVLPTISEVWFIKTHFLKEIINEYNPIDNYEGDGAENWMSVSGGDNKETRCYLWDREVFKMIMWRKHKNSLKIIKRNDIP